MARAKGGQPAAGSRQLTCGTSALPIALVTVTIRIVPIVLLVCPAEMNNIARRDLIIAVCVPHSAASTC